MKRIRIVFFLTVVFLFVASTAAFSFPTGFSFFADSAPNVYGSPNWAPWWSQTQTDVVAGTFTNMRTGTYPGTTTMSPYDEIVYSTMDLGKRLHWIYWLPGQTTAGLNGLFEVKMVVDWDGVNYTYDWGAGGTLVVDSPTLGWIQPGSWTNYSGGVIGSFGHAWWAWDDLALPGNTDSNAFNEVDQADIDALANQVYTYQTFATGYARYRASTSDPWTVTSLQVDVVPEPGSLFLLGSGLLCFGLFGWLRRRRSQVQNK